MRAYKRMFCVQSNAPRRAKSKSINNDGNQIFWSPANPSKTFNTRTDLRCIRLKKY